jgi:hypothetical protein
MKGRGLITQPDGTVEWDENDDDLNVRDPHGFIDGSYRHENGKFILDMEEGPLRGQRELDESNVKSNTTHDYGLDDSFDDIHDDSWISDEEDEDDELREIQKERNELVDKVKIITKGFDLSEVEDSLSVSNKQLQKENIILNLENTKISNEIIKELTSFYETSNEITIKKIPKELYTKTKQKIVKEILELHNDEKLSQRSIETTITRYQKVLKAKTPNEVRVIIGQLLVDLSDQYKGNPLQKTMKKIGVQIMGVLVPELLEKIDTNDAKINNNHDKINDLFLKQTQIQSNMDEVNKYVDRYEKLGKKYNTRKQELQSKERNTEEQIQKIRELKKSNPERAKAEANELKDELLEKVEKLKQQQQKKPEKPVKKSDEETQSDITNADVTNRLEHIKTLPVAGKPLETYLSGNGEVILQYSTGDYSKIYDNEFNKEIPNIKVTLNNGKVESLRKAVTIDLYSDKNVYEIKNYTQYSIKDIIPLQETKIEGTGYFKPLYFQNGKLYNIQLNYTNPKTGQELSKYILPENEEGRTLNVIYRLKEGLFELKPMDLDQVETKLSTYKSIGGKDLYLFEKSNLKPCLDHYGNPSYNIQPYLKPIKLRLKK